MKRLTVNQTWEQCLAMWKWISRQSLHSKRSTESIKRRYLAKHKTGYIFNGCFFCEYIAKRDKGCNLCPGHKIDKDFHCINCSYNYNDKPRLFYAKLKELNKIRLAGKK
jgi:hypothetical protein